MVLNSYPCGTNCHPKMRESLVENTQNPRNKKEFFTAELSEPS